MNILLDIAHPAHVHYFRCLVKEMSPSHKFWVTTKESQIIKRLLDHYEIDYQIVGSKGKSLTAKAIKQAMFTMQAVRMMKDNNIDYAMGVSVTAAQAARLCGKTSFYFDDDDLNISPLSAISGTRFAANVLSPDPLSYEKTKNAVYYPGYHELAYLHPKRFTPDPGILQKYGVSPEEPYFILRFNAFTAHHDVHHGGMNSAQKRELVTLLESYGRVFVNTEAKIDPEFERLKMPILAHEMHHFLSFARMLVSDSQTMTSEAAVLGVPSFRCNSFVGKISYLEEEEKRYKLTFGFLPRQFKWMLESIQNLLKESELRSEWQLRRQRLLKDKIDVSGFWIWFIENYPKSREMVRSKNFTYDSFR